MFIKKSQYKGIFMACIMLAVVGGQANASANWNANAINQLQMKVGATVSGLPESQRMALLEFYKSPTVVLLWSDQNGRLARAGELRQMLQQSMTHGLDPSPYRLQEIETYWGKNDVSSAVTLEMLLSQALLTYANELYSGRYAPHDVDKEWHMKPRVLDNSKLLLDVSGQLSITDTLSDLAPSHSIYSALQKRLAEYRQLPEQGGWPVIAKGPTLRPGMQHEQIKQIRQRLSVTGDLQDAGQMASPVFDDTLVAAVKHYQTRNGLHADGIIGNGTRAAMNIPVEQRVIQMRINLERWRWLPLEFRGHSFVVNMTGYMLYSFQDHEIVLEMPVIVGKKYRSTPSFNNLMSYVELNPYWNVPTSIAVKDLIPAQKRNSGYLKKKHIRVFRGWKKDAKELDPATVDWSKVSEKHFPYRLRQDPGPHNALGTMKFMFPNKYAIYLHDTPHRELFKRHDRAFSSGCIRVQDPLYLATYVMGDTSAAGRARIEKLLATGKNQALRLPKKIPIYLVYTTSWVDRKGNLNFRKDIYGRDKRMLAAVCKNRAKKCEKAQISY
ncbi:MAG TPA: hypothetical protein ENI64_10430 [Gammaproteobacteria bacterium]|nr:hypothetical protein [Gammaproteobacteria bacterium]